MKKIEIKHRFTNAVLFTTEVDDDDAFPVRTAVTRAVDAGADLADAYLADAYLADAYLADARNNPGRRLCGRSADTLQATTGQRDVRRSCAPLSRGTAGRSRRRRSGREDPGLRHRRRGHARDGRVAW